MIFKIDKQDEFTSGYYIEIEFMHGDADGYTKETWGPFKEQKFKEASEFCEFLNYVINGKYTTGGYSRRRNADDAIWPDEYKKFVDLDDIDFNDTNNQWPLFTLYDAWPGDITADHQYRAAINSWEVYYISEDGRKFKVKVEKE